jgi:hypothetical protein
MKKNTGKLKTTRKKTINNIVTKKEGGVWFIRKDTKGEESYRGRLGNTRMSTRKANTTRKKTINNTIKKEGEFDWLEVAPKERSNTKGS